MDRLLTPLDFTVFVLILGVGIMLPNWDCAKIWNSEAPDVLSNVITLGVTKSTKIYNSRACYKDLVQVS